jgi:membrane protein
MSMTNYFPVLGSQLSDHISTLHKSGVALVIGIVFTMFGARGVADVFQQGVQHIWHEKPAKAPALPQRIAKSLAIMIVGGLGLLSASILAGLAAGVGHGIAFRALSIAVNLLVLFGLFTYLINVSLPRQVTLKETRSGAISAALGLVILQAFGGYVLTRELKSLDALYSYFAISLGLLFWIYLQAQVLYYAVTVADVSSKKLWPRSLTGKNLTSADKKIAHRHVTHIVGPA